MGQVEIGVTCAVKKVVLHRPFYILVTKTIPYIALHFPFFPIIKVLITYWTSRTYLTTVFAALTPVNY